MKKQNNVLARFTAQILDSFIYGFLSSLPLFFFFIAITIISLTLKPSADSAFMAAFVFTAFLSLPTTYIWLNYRHLKNSSQTIGYRIMGFKLKNVDNSNLSGKKILFRIVGKMFLTPIYLLFMVGFLHLLVLIGSNAKQGLLDKIFKTEAVKV